MAYIRFALVLFALLTLLTACTSTGPNRSMLTMMTELVDADDPVHVKLERIDALDTSKPPWVDLE